MVSSRGKKKKLEPRPDRSPLGVWLKISDEHPHPFHMRSPPPGHAYGSSCYVRLEEYRLDGVTQLNLKKKLNIIRDGIFFI